MSRTEHFSNDLDRLANKRANRKMGWYIHAFVFLAVNLGWMAIAAASGRPWVFFPSFGWALGLAIHGFVVFAFAPGNGLRERMVERERALLAVQLAAQPSFQRDPW
jgi:hypothetical protein